MRCLRSIITAVAVLSVAGIAWAGTMHVDENPAVSDSPGSGPGDLILSIWDMQYVFDVSTPSGGLGNAGCEFDGTYFYSTRWASNLIHQYDIDGNLVKQFSIPGVSGLRDLAYDGTYFYGGAAGGTIWQMDFDSETLVGTITGSFQCRAIAYNEDDDTFFCSNWGDPVWEVNRSGTIVNSFNLTTATSNYGFAYDNVCGDGGPYLWVFDQGDGSGFSQYILQYDLGSGSFTGVSHDVLADFPGTSGIAGGLFFTTDLIPGTASIGGLWQTEDPYPNLIVCYEICHPAADLEVDIVPVNGQDFSPGDWVQYAITVTNNSTSPITGAVGRVYATNTLAWQLTLWGPLTFNIPAQTTIGPVNLQSRIHPGAPSLSAFICAEVNDVYDCYQINIE